MAVTPDGQRILTSFADNTILVSRLNGAVHNVYADLHAKTRNGEEFVAALVAMPDNQLALSGGWDKTVKLFNVDDGAVLRTFTHHNSMVQCLALHPDGRRFVSGVYTVDMHDPDVDEEGPSICIVEHGLSPCPDAAYSPARAEAAARIAADAHRKSMVEAGLSPP